MNKPRIVTAVRSGTLPGVDCYIGDDGERYLSSRENRENTEFALLLKASGDAAPGSDVEIRIPVHGGGFRTASGRPARSLIAFILELVAGVASGALQAEHVPLVPHAAALLGSLAKMAPELGIVEPEPRRLAAPARRLRSSRRRRP